MIGTNQEFLEKLNGMLKKYDIQVSIGSGPENQPSFYSSIEKEIVINRFS